MADNESGNIEAEPVEEVLTSEEQTLALLVPDAKNLSPGDRQRLLMSAGAVMGDNVDQALGGRESSIEEATTGSPPVSPNVAPAQEKTGPDGQGGAGGLGGR